MYSNNFFIFSCQFFIIFFFELSIGFVPLADDCLARTGVDGLVVLVVVSVRLCAGLFAPRRVRLLMAVGHLGDHTLLAGKGIHLCAVGLDEGLDDGDNVVDQSVNHAARARLSDDDSEDRDVLGIHWQRVVWNDPALDSQQSRDGLLLHVRILLVEGIGETEGDDGETGVEILAADILAGHLLGAVVKATLGGDVVVKGALWTVDVGDTFKVAATLERRRQDSSVFEIRLSDACIAVETEMEERKVLRDDIGSWSGEVESVRFFSASEVV